MNNREIKVSVKDIPEIIEKLEWAEKTINDLQSKIDKALDYIEENQYRLNIDIVKDELINILQGKDKGEDK